MPVLQKDSSLVHGTMFGYSQLSVTPSPEDLIISASLCRNPHTLIDRSCKALAGCAIAQLSLKLQDGQGYVENLSQKNTIN